jgi:large subunit ribosomal protein L28
MPRRCALSGKSVQYGNNVSHANNKTRRRFMSNLQVGSVLSDALGHTVRLRLTPRGMKTIEHNGGIDAYLLGTNDSKLSEKGRVSGLFYCLSSNSSRMLRWSGLKLSSEISQSSVSPRMPLVTASPSRLSTA